MGGRHLQGTGRHQEYVEGARTANPWYGPMDRQRRAPRKQPGGGTDQGRRYLQGCHCLGQEAESRSTQTQEQAQQAESHGKTCSSWRPYAGTKQHGQRMALHDMQENVKCMVKAHATEMWRSSCNDMGTSRSSLGRLRAQFWQGTSTDVIRKHGVVQPLRSLRVAQSSGAETPVHRESQPKMDRCMDGPDEIGAQNQLDSKIR